MALRSARDSQIFIIGCGISGIGAAQKLLKHGFHNVHIIEATARSGGRIRTGRLGMYVQSCRKGCAKCATAQGLEQNKVTADFMM